MKELITRREAAGLLLGTLGMPAIAAGRKISVAAVVTEYRFWSHADVICGRLMAGYSMNGIHREPKSRIVSLYTDQVPNNDMSRDLAARHGFKIYPTIAETLTLGRDKLAVDAVVFIGEHGDYPENDVGQKLYPRYELFMQILDVYERSSRSVPTFFDKHLSYSWEKAKEIYDRAAKLQAPWMAGSSVPLTVRNPPLELAPGTRLESALMVGYGGLDAYGFHTVELLQAMVERRAGGETGVRSVHLLENEAVWNWRDGEGAWSKPLLEAALSRCPDRREGPLQQQVRQPAALIIDYEDSLRSVCYMLNGATANWAFAAQPRESERVLSCHFGLLEKGRPLPHFDGLVYCIEQLFVTGKPMYPVERTLLSTGALAFLFESKRRGTRVDTPELAIRYQPAKNGFFQKA